MTVFEVNKVFHGVCCPECGDKVTVSFNSDNLFRPFTGFAVVNGKYCCAKFHEQLNAYINRQREGMINHDQLINELNLYKMA